MQCIPCHSTEKATDKKQRTCAHTQIHILEMASVFINIRDPGIHAYQIVHLPPSYLLSKGFFLVENAHPSCQGYTPSAEGFSGSRMRTHTARCTCFYCLSPQEPRARKSAFLQLQSDVGKQAWAPAVSQHREGLCRLLR